MAVAGFQLASGSSLEVKSEGLPEGAVPHAVDADRVRKRVCASCLTWAAFPWSIVILIFVVLASCDKP